MKIEQLIHGYNNGHHLIASSISLPIEDADKMSRISDWTGYINSIDKGTDYIMAYPLEKSHLYVIARSWYAHEMSRPGCVWTHSFLVDFDSMGQDTNFYNLVRLFRRPKEDGEDFISYTKSIQLKEEKTLEKVKPIDGLDPVRMMFMIAGLMERNKPMVYATEKGADFYIDLCLRLIQNIPYGILREISICSGSSNVRKIGNVFFNLQFVTSKGETLIEPYPQNISKPTADRGFQFWIDSLVGGRQDVAQMIHRFSEDIGNNSMKFLAVANLLKLLDDKIRKTNEESGIKDIIKHLTSEFKAKESGAKLKRAYLSENVTKLFCDERTFIVELATTNENKSLDYLQIDYKGRVSNYRNQHTTDEYIDILVELSKADNLNEEGRNVLAHAMDGMTKEEMLSCANKDWGLFKTIATLNINLLSSDFWIDLPSTQFLSLFAIFQREVPLIFMGWEKLFDKLLTIDTFVADNICHELARNVDHYVKIALDRWNSARIMPINKTLMSLCMKQKKDVLQWISFQNNINDDIRDFIKENIRPDDTTVVAMGSDVWKVFVKEELNDEKNANKLIYIYILAFNWRDYTALSYIKGVLPYIYEALSLETLSHISWMKIQKFTGEVPVWRFWDNCRKVLIGVKNYCKEMNLSSQEIENFTIHHKLNEELMELWRKG